MSSNKARNKSFLRILVQSLLASNIGYTVFLLPLLGYIFPKRIPLTLMNIIAFTVVDTMAGLFLAGLAYLFIKKAKLKKSSAFGISIVILWALYWIPASLKSLNLLMIGLDGLAALITWLVILVFQKIWK